MTTAKTFQIEYFQGQWNIADPSNPRVTIAIDQAVVDATKVSADGRVVEGYVRAVQGLYQTIAEHFPRSILSALGVVSGKLDEQTRSTRRVRLNPGGEIEYISVGALWLTK